MNFTITTGTNPVPTINRLLPSVTAVGGSAFTLTVGGSNFVSGSVVRWNGSDRPTAFVNSTQVTAQIPASDIAAVGTATIAVFNPPPGGGTSNSLNFSIVTALRPVSVAVAPDPSAKFGKFAYVANGGSNNVSMYTIDATTGTLTSIGTIDAGLGPSSVTVYPSGRFAYVINHNLGVSDYISMFTLDATTGALTSTGTVAAPYATSMAVDPFGKLAYVAFCIGVYTYSINGATGTLTSIGRVDAPFSTCSLSPQSLAVHPSGKFAYLASADEERLGRPEGVTMYTVNASTGELTSIGVVQAGLAPWSVAIDPSSKFAYVANLYSGNISIFNVNATTGTLTSVGTIDAGGSPSSVAVDPSGKFAYVTNGGVSMYTIDATTGALTSIGTIAAGSAPNSIAIDPSGKFAYVANSLSNNVSMYAIDATTGALTLIGTIGT